MRSVQDIDLIGFQADTSATRAVCSTHDAAQLVLRAMASGNTAMSKSIMYKTGKPKTRQTQIPTGQQQMYRCALYAVVAKADGHMYSLYCGDDGG